MGRGFDGLDMDYERCAPRSWYLSRADMPWTKITSSTSCIYDHNLGEVHSIEWSFSSPYVDVAAWVHQIRFFINWTSSHEVRKSITALKLGLRSLRCDLYEQDIFL